MNGIPPMKIFSSLVLATVLGLVSWKAAIFLHQSSLPYQDSFGRNDATEWVPMGGDWQISDGTVINRSDEHGAKLLTGSSEWKDYELDTELELIGHEGDVGVMVRVEDEELGVDSYNGYYVGLRSLDSALVIGRADHGWIEGRPEAMQGGVQTGVWYSLRVVIVGCNIGAEAVNVATKQTSWAAFEEQPCVPRGKIGLRSMATGGAWRKVSVRRAAYADFITIRNHASFLQTPIYPIREDEYNRMRESNFRSTFTSPRSYRSPDTSTESSSAETTPTPPLIPIESARASTGQNKTVRLRGVVTLTSPMYIQDNTGGIAVTLLKTQPLNLGDEIEVIGAVIANNSSSHFVANEVHLLGDRTLLVPVSVTSTQAADGAFDGRLVELRATLRSKQVATDDEITLLLEDTEQTFRVVGRGGLSPKQFDAWIPGSELRVRGICTVGPWLRPEGGSFTILLRSVDDVEVLSGPPWWSPRRMARYIVFLLMLLVLGGYFYLRMERWKISAILGERERLAHEMHDTLAQSFAGVGFHLQGVRNSLRTGSIDIPAVKEKLDVACDMVTRTHREASAEIAALHPDSHRDFDLLTTLERCRRSMLDDSLPPLTLVREGVPRTLSLTVRDALFQIGRESLANILRHSRATETVLKLRYEAKHLVLEISDNGDGFDYEEHADGFGILGMRKRCQKVGAVLEIKTAPGRGTCVIVRAPYGARPALSDWLLSDRVRPRRSA